MTVPLLAAGDDFVTNDLIDRALRASGDAELRLSRTLIPWPVPPFGPVGEVDEAAGTEEQMIEALQGQRVCVTQMAPFTRRVLDAAPDLELLAVARGGVVNVNLDAAREHDVTVVNAPGRNARATAEHTVAMMLTAMRRIPQTHASILAGEWRSDLYALDQVGPELGTSVVGIVGFGAIGQQVAAMVSALGAEVLVHDPFLPSGAPVTSAPLDFVLSRADVLTVHARLTADTRNLVGRREIGLLPPGAIVVNCARGGLVDYDALCDALDSGHLFAAATDVFPEEPVPPDSRLLRTPHLVMTPHLAGASRQTAELGARLVAEDVHRFLRGRPVRHPVG